VNEKTAYSLSGVDIAAGQKATELMRLAVEATYGAEVLAGLGSFGGLYDANLLKELNAPVLVASTDGVGTKTKVAARLDQWQTIGRDLVNHCINDILVQGARPLFFLDYVAASKLDPQRIATIVGGVAAACREAKCALLGGETAEMPGVYQFGEVDLAGTIVGIVERKRIIDGSRIRPGDLLLGLRSTGLHTNGYSLARSVLEKHDWTTPLAELGCSIGEALLAVHRSYLEPIRHLMTAGVEIRGLAHITGGGFRDNLPRILPEGVGALIQRGSWPEIPIFRLIQRVGFIPDEEMFHVFNMGIGMIVVIPSENVSLARATIPEISVIGTTTAGPSRVIIREA